MRPVALALALLALAACGAPAAVGGPAETPAPAVSHTPVPDPTPNRQPPPEACPAPAFAAGEGSLTTIRVRERLGFIPAPFDAVLTASSLTGSFLLRDDGTFAPCSRLVVETRTVRSADTALHPEILRRDGPVRHILAVDRFPEAVLVPLRVSGLPLPLPARGEWRFALDGRLTIRGVEREARWEVEARREGDSLEAVATTAFAFEDFGLERPSQVLSLDERIRLEVRLVARRGGG